MAWTPMRLRFRSGAIIFDGEAEGAGGGSQTSVQWYGPFPFDHADYIPASAGGGVGAGGGVDGFLLGYEPDVGSLMLRSAAIIDVDFDGTPGELGTWIAHSALPANEYIAGMNLFGFSPLAIDYVTLGFPTVVVSQNLAALLSGWLITEQSYTFVSGNNFATPPTTGHGRVWFEVATPVLPA